MNTEYFKNYMNGIAVMAAVIAMSLSFFGSNVFDGGDTNIWVWAAIATSAYAAIFSVFFSRLRERRLRQRRIFIIYPPNPKDRERAEVIVQYLRDIGYNPWFDMDEIAPGQKWGASIRKGLEESAVALYLVTKNIKESEDIVAEQLKAALSMMRSKDESFSPVIPVIFDNTQVPSELSDVQSVDLTEGNVDEGITQLEKGLKRVLG